MCDPSAADRASVHSRGRGCSGLPATPEACRRHTTRHELSGASARRARAHEQALPAGAGLRGSARAVLECRACAPAWGDAHGAGGSPSVGEAPFDCRSSCGALGAPAELFVRPPPGHSQSPRGRHRHSPPHPHPPVSGTRSSPGAAQTKTGRPAGSAPDLGAGRDKISRRAGGINADAEVPGTRTARPALHGPPRPSPPRAAASRAGRRPGSSRSRPAGLRKRRAGTQSSVGGPGPLLHSRCPGLACGSGGRGGECGLFLRFRCLGES